MNALIIRSLRFAKWRIAIPMASALGIPRSQIERLVLPEVVRGHLRKGRRVRGAHLLGPRLHIDEFRRTYTSLLHEKGRPAADQHLEETLRAFPRGAADIRWAQFKANEDMDPLGSLELAESVYRDFPESRFQRGLLYSYNRAGNIHRALELARDLANTEGPSRTLDILEARAKLLEDGFPLPEQVGSPQYEPTANRVLYLLHNSLPHSSGGYATRTHGLVTALRDHGWDVECATRLGYPGDVAESASGGIDACEHVDGVPYHRLHDGDGSYRRVDAARYLELNASATIELARRRRPAVIHGASNHINGLTAAIVGRTLGVPSVYEVRGLWELTRLSRQPEFEGSEYYQLIVRLETQACMAVDQVITITDALKELLIERGVPSDKISVVPNGVNCDRFSVPGVERNDVREQWNIPADATVFGYVGSMPQYEGLDDLVGACAQVQKTSANPIYCLLVGDGDQLESLHEDARTLGIEDRVIFTGRVPHETVDDYYAAMDVMVFPRKPQPVTEIVSPIKPFEAMAMEKPILVSSVSALAEIVKPDETGVIFKKGDIGDLAEKMKQLSEDREIRADVARNAGRWVREYRDWSALSERVGNLYQGILKGH